MDVPVIDTETQYKERRKSLAFWLDLNILSTFEVLNKDKVVESSGFLGQKK